MSWRVTLHCTRAEAEAVPDSDYLFQFSDSPPVIVADEPDPQAPDDWRIHAYFTDQPTTQELVLLKHLARDGEPEVDHLGEDDWVTMSQAGLEPIRAGRFVVHTPSHAPEPDSINFEIDAGLAFGTGQHATTAGCLAALDRLERSGKGYANIADIGTGTGLLAFAAMQLWPRSFATASDIDPVCEPAVAENAANNGMMPGQRAGKLAMVIAEGLDDADLQRRAPYDLVIANILAGPLIDLAADIGAVTLPQGQAVLSGLLGTQAAAVARAYRRQGFRLVERLDLGDWTVLRLRKRGLRWASTR